jgi:hypothetical protein
VISDEAGACRAGGLYLDEDLYSYRSEAWARQFFQRCFFRATHSHLPPIAKVAWMRKEHFENVVTYRTSSIGLPTPWPMD